MTDDVTAVPGEQDGSQGRIVQVMSPTEMQPMGTGDFAVSWTAS